MVDRNRTKTELFFNSRRMLFINGQVAKGNLKKRRIRRMTEVFDRIQIRNELNNLVELANAKWVL